MKKGISLIVLVITIIVMIILAASVVISLSDTGIINKANQAVQVTDEKQVQDLASLVWAEAYLDPIKKENIVNVVKQELESQGITEEKWDITVSNTGVSVTIKKTAYNLGSMITTDNYGDLVDYTVTVDGKTYNSWQIYYHNDDYVFLILNGTLPNKVKLNKGTTVASLTEDELNLYNKFRVGTSDKFTLADTVDSKIGYNCKAVAQLIKDYANFANMTAYNGNVIGAIGSPTLELLAAGWNAKKYTPTMELSLDTFGYKINDAIYLKDLTSDGLYVGEYNCWVASPSSKGNGYAFLSIPGYVSYGDCSGTQSVRPVVCLKASIPATIGTGDYDFNLKK